MLSVRLRPTSGFTLVEIVVVTLIFCTILGIGTLSMTRIQTDRVLETSAQDLQAALRYARELAVSQNGATVAFSLPTGGTASFTISNGAGRIMRRVILPRGVDLTIAPAGQTTLTYVPNGAASVDGLLTLRGSSGRMRQLSLVAATGAIVQVGP